MWKVIFRKEFAEVFGDSRTRFNVVIGPLLFTPLLLALIGSLSRSQAKEAQKQQVQIGVVGLKNAASVNAELNGSKAKGITFVEVSSTAEAEQKIRSRQLSAALIIASDAEEKMKSEESAPLMVVDDPGSESSQQGADRLREYLRLRGDQIAARRLQSKGIPTQTTQPFLLTDREMTGSGRGMLMLTAFLPYVLSISAIMGGLMAATNTVAGEKERGTLETLLVTPVSRQDIAIGKFLTVTATALISGTLSLIGMLWPFYVKLPMFAWMASQGISFKPAAIIALILVQIPLAVFGAGMLLALSTYAKNQREMQTYTVPVLLLGTVGALLSMLLKADSPLIWSVVPITNAALVLKQALQGIVDLPFITIACLTSLLYAVAAVMLAAHLFRRESVLTRF